MNKEGLILWTVLVLGGCNWVLLLHVVSKVNEILHRLDQ